MNSTGKVAIVTGAGSGIGRSVALAFLKDGYRVALAGRRKDKLDETAKESGAGERALVVQTDVTDARSVKALFAATKEKFGRLDVLFNNAGIGTPGSINNGSISAHAPRPNSAPYTSTKHAVTGLTKSTALDGRKYDIACGQIDIGNART